MGYTRAAVKLLAKREGARECFIVELMFCVLGEKTLKTKKKKRKRRKKKALYERSSFIKSFAFTNWLIIIKV